MPLDPARVAEARGWLSRAANDLRGADVDLAALEPVCREAELLTPFAWIFRYPGDLVEPPVEEIRGALALARRLWEAVACARPLHALRSTSAWRRPPSGKASRSSDPEPGGEAR